MFCFCSAFVQVFLYSCYCILILIPSKIKKTKIAKVSTKFRNIEKNYVGYISKVWKNRLLDFDFELNAVDYLVEF